MNRVDYIDYAKAIGIILVVMGHINPYSHPCKVWIYAFHMPLFFLLSGLLLKSTDSYKTFITKKARRIIVPYFVWGLIFAAFSLKNLLCVCYGSHQTLYRAETLSSLWFFPVLFVAYIISEVFINVAYKRNKNPMIQKILWGGVMLILGFLLPNLRYGYLWGLNIAFVATGFMMIGKCMFDMFTRIRAMSNIKLMVVSTVLAIATIGAYLNFTIAHVDMADAIYGNPILFLSSAIVGSAFVLCLSMLIERVNMGFINNWLLYVGQNSLTIMLLHKPVISFAVKGISKFEHLHSSVCLLIVTLLTISLCCVGAAILNKSIPQIVGK